MKRPRIKRSILAFSSDTNKLSIYRESLKVNHEKNKEYFQHIKETVTLKLKKRYFYKIWGKRIPIPLEDVSKYNPDELEVEEYV